MLNQSLLVFITVEILTQYTVGVLKKVAIYGIIKENAKEEKFYAKR